MVFSIASLTNYDLGINSLLTYVRVLLFYFLILFVTFRIFFFFFFLRENFFTQASHVTDMIFFLICVNHPGFK